MTVVTLYLIPQVFHGDAHPTLALDEIAAWFRLLTTSTPDLMMGITNVNILGVFGRWWGLPVAKGAWAMALLGYGVVAWKLRSSPMKTRLMVGLAAIYFLHPLTWTYWVLLLVPTFLAGWKAAVFELTRKPSSREIKQKSPLAYRAWIFGAFVVTAVSFNLQNSYFNKEWPLLFASVVLVVSCFFTVRGKKVERALTSPTRLHSDIKKALR
jgi:hypothetical protein